MKRPDEYENELHARDRRIQELEEQKNGAYSERNKCVALIAKMAVSLGIKAGVREHPLEDTRWENDWRTVVFIDLPTGQVSWHFHDSEQHLLGGLPRYIGQWDGHSTEEKYRRCAAYRTGDKAVDLLFMKDKQIEQLEKERNEALEDVEYLNECVASLESKLAEAKAAFIRLDPFLPHVEGTKLHQYSEHSKAVEALRAALSPTPEAAPKVVLHDFRCACGSCDRVDEDGCCVSCGSAAVDVGDVAAELRAENERLKAELRAEKFISNTYALEAEKLRNDRDTLQSALTALREEAVELKKERDRAVELAQDNERGFAVYHLKNLVELIRARGKK